MGNQRNGRYRNGKTKNHSRFFEAEGKYAIPTPEHYLPLLYTLGLKQENEEVSFINDVAVGGSLTMTSVLIKPKD